MRLQKLKFLILGVSLLISNLAVDAKKSNDQESYVYNRGLEALNKEDYEDAKQWFLRELADNPKNGTAYLFLAAITYQDFDLSEAISYLEKGMKYLPKKDKQSRSAAYSLKGQISLALGDTLAGLDNYAAAIRLNPQSEDLLEERAELYYDINDYKRAEADYLRLLEINPGSELANMGLGRNAFDHGRLKEAIEHFGKTIKLNPNHALAYSWRAQCYGQQGKWREATDDIIRALDIDRNDKAYYYMVELPEEARGMMGTKLKIQMTKNPAESYWPFCIAAVSQIQEDYPTAIEYYKKAIDLDADPTLFNRMARCYINMNEYSHALEYLEKSVAMDPENYQSKEIYADALERTGHFQKALEQRNKVIEAYPEHTLGYLNRAGTYMYLRDYSNVIEDMNTAMVLTDGLDTVPSLLLKRGDAYRLLGKKKEADTDYRNALAHLKDSTVNPEKWLPFIYSGLGDKDKALESMRIALEKDSADSIQGLYNLGCIYSRVGMKDEAVETFGEMIDKGFKDPYMLNYDYDLDPIRDMPQFNSLIEKVKMEMSSGEGDDKDEPVVLETVEVPFTREQGVTRVKCEINELPLHFVFDTGASDVTLSLVEANFMLKNGYVRPQDIIGSARYIDANGDIEEGTVLNLQKVNFGGLELDNVRASVVRNQKAPLLLGQSVLSRLGKIEIDNHNQKLKITHRVKK